MIWWLTDAWAHSGAVPIRGQYDWSNLPDAEPMVWWVWEFSPSIVMGCLAFLGIYAYLAGPARIKHGWAKEGPSRLQWLSFCSSIALVFFSLQGPLHELSDLYLFSAHMVQHLLITLVFPPLLIRGIPSWMWQPVVSRPSLTRFGRAITRPVPAIFIAVGSLYLWHIPEMYQWAMVDHNVHIVEHLMFMTGAVIMWWPAHSPLAEVPPLSPGLKLFYLVALTVPMKALGALITVSDEVLYPFYALQPRVFGLDPLEDQRLGGFFMWMPGGLLIWFNFGWVFFRDLYGSVFRERKERAALTEASP